MGQQQEIGTVEEAINGSEGRKKTFASYYGEIVRKIRKKNPESKLFLVTMPRESSDTEEIDEKKNRHAILLHAIAEKLNDIWVIDFYQYVPVYDQKFKNHLTN